MKMLTESYVDYCLFNFENFSFEKEGRIILNKELSEEFAQHDVIVETPYLENKGIVIKNNPEILISDKKLFLSYIRSILFKGYNIVDCAGRYKEDVGHPDFIVRNDKEEFYVELKVNEDSLRLSQMKWICKNKHKKIKVLWVFINVNDLKETFKIPLSTNPDFNDAPLVL